MSTQWCFHRMARNWPQHLMTERCDCGMAKQAPKLLSFKGTHIRSTQWCFHQMARNWPQHLMTERCDCGMAKQAPKLLSFEGTRMGQVSGVFTDGTKLASASHDKRCDCGMAKQAPKLLSFEGTRIRSTQWCFHQMARTGLSI
jgi:hypothetical protein